MAKAKTMRLPKGTFVYPYLTRPDEYKGVENFKCKLRVPLAEAQPTIQAMLAQEQAKDTVMNDGEPVTYGEEPYVPYTIDETGGFVEFTTKLRRFGGRKGSEFEQRPDVFDAQLRPLGADVDVMGGSEGCLVVAPFRWGSGKEGKIGISLRLMAAQVVKLCDKLERDAESYGFAAEEDGYDSTAPSEGDEGQGDAEVDASGRESY